MVLWFPRQGGCAVEWLKNILAWIHRESLRNYPLVMFDREAEKV